MKKKLFEAMIEVRFSSFYLMNMGEKLVCIKHPSKISLSVNNE